MMTATDKAPGRDQLGLIISSYGHEVTRDFCLFLTVSKKTSCAVLLQKGRVSERYQLG